MNLEGVKHENVLIQARFYEFNNTYTFEKTYLFLSRVNKFSTGLNFIFRNTYALISVFRDISPIISTMKELTVKKKN